MDYYSGMFASGLWIVGIWPRCYLRLYEEVSIFADYMEPQLCQVLAVTVGQLLNISVPQFHCLLNGNTGSIYFTYSVAMRITSIKLVNHC